MNTNLLALAGMLAIESLDSEEIKRQEQSHESIKETAETILQKLGHRVGHLTGHPVRFRLTAELTYDLEEAHRFLLRAKDGQELKSFIWRMKKAVQKARECDLPWVVVQTARGKV